MTTLFCTQPHLMRSRSEPLVASSINLDRPPLLKRSQSAGESTFRIFAPDGNSDQKVEHKYFDPDGNSDDAEELEKARQERSIARGKYQKEQKQVQQIEKLRKQVQAQKEQTDQMQKQLQKQELQMEQLLNKMKKMEQLYIMKAIMQQMCFTSPAAAAAAAASAAAEKGARPRR